METQTLLDELEIVLFSGKPPDVSSVEMKKILDHVKNLERCLADALRLANERKVAA